MRALRQGLVDSLSIGIGYVPIAFSFGLTATQAHLPHAIVFLTSAVIYAGASQFALVAMLAAGGTFGAAAGTVLLMNIRHVFYGPALSARMGVALPSRPTPLLAFGLTDEVFASAVSKMPKIALADRESWYLGLQLGPYLSWVSGTELGVLFGQELASRSTFLRHALDFVLPALFLSLLLEIDARPGDRRVLVIAGALTAVLLLLIPFNWALIGGMVAGAALGSFFEPRQD